MNIGERIKYLRKQNNINQAHLASVLQSFYGMKTDRVAISKWEIGYQLPNIQAVRAIADYFGVTADYLMNGRQAESNSRAIPFYRNYPDIDSVTCINCDTDADICVVAPDDSMRASGIVQGACVFVNTKCQIADGNILLVIAGDTAYIRRCYKNGDAVLLVSDWGSNPPAMYPLNQVEIVGKICSVRFDFD